MIYDIILVAIVIVLVLINYFRGAAKALAGILTAIASYALATVLGKLLAFRIYDALVQPAIEKAIGGAINNLSVDTAAKLPSWLSGLLSLSGKEPSELIQGALSGVSEPAVNAVDGALRPIAQNILIFFITLLLFLLLCFLIRLVIVRPVLKLFELPVIRTANRIIGGVIGLIDAFLLISMLAYLTKLLLPTFGSQTGWFNESTIYNSFIFYHFYSGNIFTAIGSLIK